MLQIKKITWPHAEFTNLAYLRDLLRSRLAAAGISTNITTSPENDGILFLAVKDDKYVASVKQNKLIKSGKTLKSYRLTEKQFKSFFDILYGTVNELGVLCSIHMIEKDQTTYHLRDGNEDLRWNIPSPRSFPVEA